MTTLANVKYRKSTSFSVTFPTLPSLTYKPQRVELFQKKYEHDILMLGYPLTSDVWMKSIKTGVPVQFTWNQGDVVEQFWGYVSFISQHTAAQNVSEMEVYCIGTTFPLKDRATKIWTNVTISDVVKEIVTFFGFNFTGVETGVIFDQLSMSGHSYWEWINEQAKRIGYGVLVSGMDFIFAPLDDLVDYNITSVPVMSITDSSIPINNQFLDRTLDTFKVMQGEYVESDQSLRTTKTVAGVDPLSGQIISAVSSPDSVGQNLREAVSDVWFSGFSSEKVATSVGMAEALAKGSAQNVRMNMPAKVKGQGDPRLKPFGPVLIQGTGPMTDGYWVVEEVLHQFSRIGDYQVQMIVKSDGTGLNNRTAKRLGNDTVVGVVNLNAALENKGIMLTFGNKNSVVLNNKSPFVTEGNQGFNRTNSRWTYSASRIDS